MKRNNFVRAALGALLFFGCRAAAALPSSAFLETQTIIIPNARPFEDFGNALDASNGLLIGGAINSLNSSGLETGAAYIYQRSPDGSWTQNAKLTPTGGQYDEQFGYSVGIDGDFALVGARTHTETSFGRGAVYFFHRVNDSQWQQVDSFFPPVQSHNLGIYADLHGSQAAVAGMQSVVPGVGGTRAFVNIYERAGQQSWQQTQRLDIGTQLSFVNDVAIDNGTLALGTSRRASQSQPWTYQVELFQRSATGFIRTATIAAPSGEQGSWFGFQVSLDQGRLLVGDPKEGTHGASYLYERSPNGVWNLSARLVPSDVDGRAYIGSHVAINGDTAVIDSWSTSPSVYDAIEHVFERESSGGWTEVAELTSLQSQGAFGYSLGTVDGQVLVNSGLNAPGRDPRVFESSRTAVRVVADNPRDWTGTDPIAANI